MGARPADPGRRRPHRGGRLRLLHELRQVHWCRRKPRRHGPARRLTPVGARPADPGRRRPHRGGRLRLLH
ncbi:hypothetical protein D9C01_13820, partial [Corynebacterium diphtheriae]